MLLHWTREAQASCGSVYCNMVVARLPASRLDSQEVYSSHVLQDGGCASRRLATRVTRQRRRYMIGIHGTGWGLGLESLSTVGADVQVGVWPVQQQAGQDTPQHCLKEGTA